MSDPTWLSYSGAITGVIGAVAGISGPIMGFISYRRSEKLKALDLRLELRKAEHDVREIVMGLGPLLDRTMKSHNAILAAIGQLNSGAHKQWVSEWEELPKEVRTLEENRPDPNADYKDLDHTALETRLVAVHATQFKATQILDKCNAVLEHDDKEREQLRADQRESINRAH